MTRVGYSRTFLIQILRSGFFEQPLSEMDQVTRIIDEFNREFLQGKGLTRAITLKEYGARTGTCGYGDLGSGDRGRGFPGELLGYLFKGN